jgi:hypothetical protein
VIRRAAVTNLGFGIVGASPWALIVGVGIVTAVIFAVASFAAWRRLPRRSR